jgi:hypothetical protein
VPDKTKVADEEWWEDGINCYQKEKKAFLVYVFHDSDVVIASLTRLRFLVLKFWSYSSGSWEKRLTGIQSYAGR